VSAEVTLRILVHRFLKGKTRMRLRKYIESKLTPRELENKVNQIHKPVGSLGYDPWGYNTESLGFGLTLTRFLYDKYFRVETTGVENIPSHGPVMIIGNHSGQLPLDGMLIGYAIATREHAPRFPRCMIERFFPTVPYVGNYLNELGGVLGDPVNCAKMLANDEAIIVFPEGVRGSGKLYRDRYQLKRFGNGFMHLAMQNNATIVPVGVVGCEETIPAFANISPLARRLGLPYVPLAAPVVLPAKVYLNFGEPMHFPYDDISEEEVTGRVEQVKRSISELINQGLSKRKRLF